jgi:F-type H+-transporting ATPase subunit b
MFLAESSIQLVPDGTLLLHFLFVGLMVAVLSRTLLKPINVILREREEYIIERKNKAKATATAREEMLKRYEAELRKARTEGYRLLEQERAAATKEKQEKLQSVKEEMSTWVSSEIATTRHEEEQIRRELEAQATSMAELISYRILGRRTHGSQG